MAGRDVFQLTATAPSIERNLGFIAHSVIVDNYTPSFVRVPGSVRDVPPFSFGVVLSLDGTDLAKASLVSTTPVFSGPPVPSPAATLTFLSASLPSSAGHLLQSSAFGSRSQLWPDGTSPANQKGASVVVPINSAVNPVFTLPAGATAIRIGASAAGLNFSWLLGIVGVQSGQQYFSETPGSTSAPARPFLPVTVRVDTEVDTQYTVSIVNLSLATPINIVVSYITTVESVDIQNQFTVLTATPSPAAIQSPNTKIAGSAATTAGVFKLIFGPLAGSQSGFLFWARFDIDAVSGGVFGVGTDGVTSGIFAINDNGKGPYVLGPFNGGLPLGLGPGLYVFTTNASTVRFTVAWSTL